MPKLSIVKVKLDREVNGYVVSCSSTKEAVVIDPGLPVEKIAEQLKGFTVRYILATHCHPGHVAGKDDLKELVGGETLADRLTAGLDRIEESASRLAQRPRVFFEEWDEPLISGIRWVEELVAIAGGTPIFPELAGAGLARDRIVDPVEVARRDPQVIFASWCGKKVRKATIRSRPGWGETSAVRDDRIFEIKSTYILQPGPASLTEGVQQMHTILASLT